MDAIRSHHTVRFLTRMMFGREKTIFFFIVNRLGDVFPATFQLFVL